MTARQVYDGVLTEMNKVQAPSLLLEDFNYLFNKAINQYVNKRYNIYDVNQQTTDDLRVLKATAILPVTRAEIYNAPYGTVIANNSLYGATYEVNLPLDYLHILNCVCNFYVDKQFKCYDSDTYVQFGAFRLTSDAWSQIINNFYMRPSYKKPYYFIHNVNSINDGSVPTNPYNAENMQSTGFGTGTDIALAKSVNLLFTKFKRELLDNGYTLNESCTSIVDAKVENEVLNIIEKTYYTATDKKGQVWCIVYNTSKKDFDLIKQTETQAEYDNEILLITTSNSKIYVDEEGTLIIDGQKLNGNLLLITEEFLTQYGESTILGGLPRYIDSTSVGKIDLVEKNSVHRYGNASNVRMEIRYGKDDSIFKLQSVYVDYIKTPQFIRLTQEQLDLTEDTSQIMEFPDYVCQEIINELVHIVMENATDQRLQSHVSVSQSIASPTQGQTAAQA